VSQQGLSEPVVHAILTPRVAAIIAGAPLAVLVVLSAIMIVDRELWLDEAHSVYVAQLSLNQLWNAVAGDVHPPFYFVVLHEWIAAAGDSLPALRALSFLSMLLAIVLIWFTARSEDGELGGLVALTLVALSPALLVYALEVRMYALETGMFALTLFMVRHVRMRPTTTKSCLAGIAGALAIYTHYSAIFAVAGLLGAWLLFECRNPCARRFAVLAAVVCALLVLPWLPTLFRQQSVKRAQGALVTNARTDPAALAFGGLRRPPISAAFPVRSAAENVASVLGVYPARSTALLLVLGLPFALLMIAVIRLALVWDTWILILLASASTTLTGVLLLGLHDRRYILLLAPLSALAIAHTVSQPTASRSRWVVSFSILATIGLLAAGSIRVAATPRSKPINELISLLEAQAAPKDRLLFHAPYGQVLFDYYAIRAGLTQQRSGFPESTIDWWARQAFKGWGSPVPTFRDLDHAVATQLAATAQGGDVWLLLFDTDHYDPRGLVRSHFASAGRTMSQWISTDSIWCAVRIRFHSQDSLTVGK
jgi:uncharacterized membrane protein